MNNPRHITRQHLANIVKNKHRELGQLPPSDSELEHWSKLHLIKHAKISDEILKRKIPAQILRDFA